MRLFRVTLLFVIIFSIISCTQQPSTSFRNGDLLPDLALPNPDGDTIRLSDLRGKIVLIDFWASWCKPCREEAPKLKALNERFHGQTFQKSDDFVILSVNMDHEKDKWIQAMEQDGLDWEHQVSDMRKFRDSSLPNEFLFSQIPTRYLLNEKGQMIGNDISIQKIGYELNFRLKK